MSTAMDKLLDVAMRDRILPLEQVRLPQGDDFGVTPVLANDRVIREPSGERASLDAFVRAYADEVLGEPATNSVVPIMINHVSTGRFDEYAHRLKGMVRSFVDTVGGGLDALPIVPSLGAKATYHDIIMAAETVLSIESSSDDAKAYQVSIEDLRNRWLARALPITIDVRRTLFHVIDQDRGAGPGLYIGRRADIEDGVRDEVSSGNVLVHAALNFVASEIGPWYRIPNVPFGTTPGIRGYQLFFERSATIDREDVVRMLAVKREHTLGRSKIRRQVVRKLPRTSDEGCFVFSVCGAEHDVSPVDHLYFENEESAPATLRAGLDMSYLVPLSGVVRITTLLSANESLINTMSYELEAGAAAVLMPHINYGDPAHSYIVHPLAAHSAAMFVQPHLFV